MSIRRATLLAVALLPSLARADATVPRVAAVATRDSSRDWVERCTERLERARDSLTRIDRSASKIRVEAIARETASLGDPTARDQVPMVIAFRSSADGAYVRVQITTTELQSVVASSYQEYGLWVERAGALVGTVELDRHRPFHSLYLTTLKRAVDDCLAMGAGKAR